MRSNIKHGWRMPISRKSKAAKRRDMHRKITSSRAWPSMANPA